MYHPIEGKTYRQSFVYSKGDLSYEHLEKLSSFISIRNLEKRVFLKSKYAANIIRYETTLLRDTGDLALVPVVVVVIFGNDWQSFIKLLLQYHDCFPAGLMERLSLPAYHHLDEQGQYSDFKRLQHPGS